MRPPFRPLSVFPFPSTDNLSHSPVSAPSSRSGVNRVHLFPPSFVSRNCTRKNISPTVGYRDSSRVSDRKRLDVSPQTPRSTNRAAQLDENVPHGGTNFPVESPGGFTATPAIRVQISRPRLAIRSPFASKNLGGSLAPSKWMARVREPKARLSRN